MLLKVLIWKDISQTTYWGTYLSLYIERKLKWRQYIEIAFLLVSVVGVLGSLLWAPSPMVACLLMSVYKIIELLKPSISTSTDYLDKLISLRHSCGNVHAELEALWVRLYDEPSCNMDNLRHIFFDRCKTELNKIIRLSDAMTIRSIRKFDIIANEAVIKEKKYYEQATAQIKTQSNAD